MIQSEVERAYQGPTDLTNFQFQSQKEEEETFYYNHKLNTR